MRGQPLPASPTWRPSLFLGRAAALHAIPRARVMCRLFGLTAGTVRVRATFWLLDAPDSLEAQSIRNPDGSGIGFFDQAGTPVLDKQSEPAFEDEEFRHEARRAESATFVAHVRLASVGARTVHNTHPFAMRGRIMAHNGGFGELDRLDEQLGRYRDLVLGDTDSERYFALVTQMTDAAGGDLGAGIAAAARWIADRLPVSSLNAIVATPGELWALRYPGQHALHVLERPPGPPGLRVRSATSSVHVSALDSTGSVVVASERLDGESGWRMLDPGELVHVRADLSVDSAIVLPDPPARLVLLGPGAPNVDT
jgi:predicted glutamine amidotransferase